MKTYLKLACVSVDIRGRMINPRTMLSFLCSLVTLFGQVGEIVKYNMLKRLLLHWLNGFLIDQLQDFFLFLYYFTLHAKTS